MKYCPCCDTTPDSLVFIEDIHKYFPDKYMCKTCMTNAINRLEKAVGYVHDREECCYDYKQSLLNRIKELNKERDDLYTYKEHHEFVLAQLNKMTGCDFKTLGDLLVEINNLKKDICDNKNWIGTVTSALNVPEDASARRILDKISELKNQTYIIQ